MKIREVLRESLQQTVDADHIYSMTKQIHRNYDDFGEGDLSDRIYWFDEYKLTELPISKLDLEEWEVDEDLVADHVAEIMKSRHTMPPIVFDPIARSIIDGTHRANAYAKLGYDTIPAYVGSKQSDNYGQRISYKMRSAGLVEARQYDFSLDDYQAVPYDPELNYERSPYLLNEPHIGPQEGKYLNLMLRKMKPASVLTLPDEKKAFAPYIKDGTFTLVRNNSRRWIVTLPGEEWRGPILDKLFKSLTGPPSIENKKTHAKIGMLLGIPKESIRYFLQTRT